MSSTVATSASGHAHTAATPAKGLQCRKPVLLVEPQLKGLEAPVGVRLRLIPTLAAGTFPPQKLTPERNNLRPPKQAASAQTAEEAQPPPTPLYNNAILQVGRLPVLWRTHHASPQQLQGCPALALSKPA